MKPEEQRTNVRSLDVMYKWLYFNQNILDQVPSSDADRRRWLGEIRKGGSDASPYREKLTSEKLTYYFPFFKKTIDQKK